MSRADCPAELVAAARAAGISDARVLEAMNATRWAGFVPARYVTDAYRDEPITIWHGQVTTQPSLPARMIEGLRLAGGDHVLEVGTGLGFQAALLARGEGAGATVACRARVAARARRADRSTCAALAHEPLIRISSSADRSDMGLREMPGPSAAFSLAGNGWAGALLTGAGFGGIEFAQADEPMLIGRGVDDVRPAGRVRSRDVAATAFLVWSLPLGMSSSGPRREASTPNRGMSASFPSRVAMHEHAG